MTGGHDSNNMMMKVIGKLWSSIAVEERKCYEALSEAGKLYLTRRQEAVLE